jgi:hypothetical protein
MTPLLVLVVWAACGITCGYIAGEKGRSVGGWLALGLFAGVFALVAIAAVPPVNRT